MAIIVIVIVIAVISKLVIPKCEDDATAILMGKVILFGAVCCIAFAFVAEWVPICSIIGNIAAIVTIFVALGLFFKLLFLNKK